MKQATSIIRVAVISMAVTAILIPLQASAKTTLEMLEGKWVRADFDCRNADKVRSVTVFGDRINMQGDTFRVINVDDENVITRSVISNKEWRFKIIKDRMLISYEWMLQPAEDIYTRCPN